MGSRFYVSDTASSIGFYATGTHAHDADRGAPGQVTRHPICARSYKAGRGGSTGWIGLSGHHLTSPLHRPDTKPALFLGLASNLPLSVLKTAITILPSLAVLGLASSSRRQSTAARLLLVLPSSPVDPCAASPRGPAEPVSGVCSPSASLPFSLCLAPRDGLGSSFPPPGPLLLNPTPTRRSILAYRPPLHGLL
ncbi:hypothetical protein TgHK011_006076 [Trichoderma gracile]|nr:hypothetical protein TgHK011_006076 [Trichoderma gracile]